MNTTAAAVLATIQAMDSGEKGLAGLTSAGASRASIAPENHFTGPNNPPSALGMESPTPPFYHDTGPSSQPSSPAASPMVARTKDAIVTADQNTNTIIVSAPPAVQATYKLLISQLDKRRPQVMVEVTMVTLDTSGSFALGVDLSHPDQDGEKIFFTSFGVSKVDPTTGQLSLSPGTGFNGALLGPNCFNAVVQAVATSGRTRVVSAPKVLVNDNSSATLSSTSEFPYTSINASQTVSTTSFAGYASAGTTITLTPHISEGDHLQLQYSLTLSSFTGSSSNGIPPPQETNQVNSEVTVPDGYMVVIGGLTQKNSANTATKVPFLGDIPILKYALGIQNDNNSQSTFFAFVRPVILRDDEFEDLKYYSDRDRVVAELPSDAPSSTPLVMP
jgi:general secretion pathway protein D